MRQTISILIDGYLCLMPCQLLQFLTKDGSFFSRVRRMTYTLLRKNQCTLCAHFLQNLTSLFYRTTSTGDNQLTWTIVVCDIETFTILITNSLNDIEHLLFRNSNDGTHGTRMFLESVIEDFSTFLDEGYSLFKAQYSSHYQCSILTQ